MSSNCDAFPHIDPEVLRNFLYLIKDNYHVVDRANYYLEESGYSGINIAALNQRDFLSHLSTILRDTTLDKEAQMAQLSAAEEHLRRAIIESYQRAVDTKLLKFYTSYDKYRSHGMIRSSSSQLRPIHQEIRSKLKEIKTLKEQGRDAKSNNRWNEAWEAGVTALYQAFQKLDELQAFLDDSFEAEKFTIIKKWKVITGIFVVISGILAIIVLLRFI